MNPPVGAPRPVRVTPSPQATTRRETGPSAVEAVPDAAPTVAARLVTDAERGDPLRAPSPAPDYRHHELLALQQTVGNAAVQRRLLGTAPMVQRGPKGGEPHSSLDAATVGGVNHFLEVHLRQGAVQLIVADLVKKGELDPSLVRDGTMKYDPSLSGEGATEPPLASEYKGGKPPPLRVMIGPKAFDRAVMGEEDRSNQNKKEGIPWIYTAVMHEYKHVLQYQEGPVATLRSFDALDVEAFANTIVKAKETGLFPVKDKMLDLWNRVNKHWKVIGMFPGKSSQKKLDPLYRDAHKMVVAACPKEAATLTFNPYTP